MSPLLLLILGFVARTIGEVFGSSIMPMPALVLMCGPRTAVLLMAVTTQMPSATHAALWWR